MKKDKVKKRTLHGNEKCYILAGVDGYLANGPLAIKELNKLINERHYRVKNSGTSSRVINYLEKEGLLDCDRESTVSWRKFSFKELIYLKVINALREYGFKNNQLMFVRDCFFESHFVDNANMSIHYVLNKIAIYLIVKPSGFVAFCDDMGMDFFVHKKMTSYITISINDIYNDIRESAQKDPVAYKNMSDIFAEIINDGSLNDKEMEVMKIIRDGKYSRVTIKKSADQTYIVNAENKKKAQEDEILALLRDGDYCDINVKKRDGEVVQISKEDTFKI